VITNSQAYGKHSQAYGEQGCGVGGKISDSGLS